MLDGMGRIRGLLYADNELSAGIKMLLKSKIIFRIVKNIIKIYDEL